MKWRSVAETLLITLAAVMTSMVLFGAFMMAFAGVHPVKLYTQIYRGGFGSASAWQNTLTRAAPLILTALCTALPARLGLVIIGGEGALVLGGLAAASIGLFLHGAPALVGQLGMALAAMLAGGLIIAAVGALRHGRGVNETIASLLLSYVAIYVFDFLVEGPLRDPASLNKPSTFPIDPGFLIGTMKQALPGTFLAWDVHWGLALGVAFCLLSYVLMCHTTFGFAARMVGGNVRAAQAAGVPVGRVILIACLLGGAAAGLAGMVEVAAVHGQANASLIANYGFTGILVSFIARHHPLGIIPAAILFGGLSASSGLLQRRLHLPDASVQVFMGTIFVTILLFETWYGRFRVFQPKLAGPEETTQPTKPAPSAAIEEAVVR